MSASHIPTQAELPSQTEATKPSNDQPSGQSSTPKEQEELYFDPVKKVDSTLSIDSTLSVQMIKLKIFIISIGITI